MNQIKSVVFDLDGTLMSSNSTIYKCTLRTFEEFNILAEMPEDEFNNKIGLHFGDIFRDFNIDVPDIEEFITRYKTHYFDFIDDTYVFPNVVDTLKYLKDKNISLALLTTKAQEQAELILEHFALSKYFDLIMGRRPDIAIKPAPDALLKICSDLGVDAASALMVGDSELDIQCGKNAGSLTCAVTFGYRKEEDLKLLNPDYIISDMKELVKIVSNP
ncbi:MAG: HAD-IA family hydrolase [Bacteroidota bacterium]|nr:HAD-IA family hydrolase [Bacteroidota bacterium]MDP4190956.1 HAD-IA family hydrolase [Bacteroidota bacterium]MDP4195359.1 HAD-IA family hydrolase [Bacteroidota bacterium]